MKLYLYLVDKSRSRTFRFHNDEKSLAAGEGGAIYDMTGLNDKQLLALLQNQDKPQRYGRHDKIVSEFNKRTAKS